MSAFSDFVDTTSDIQKIILLMLGSQNYTPIDGALKFQKILFLISKNIDWLEDELDFENYLLGPHSEKGQYELELLQMNGLAKVRNAYYLTYQGKSVFNSLSERVDDNYTRLVDDMKILINDLSDEELLGIIYFSYPETTEDSVSYEGIFSDRENIGLNLYRRKKISLLKTSMITGKSAEELIIDLKEQGRSIYKEE